MAYSLAPVIKQQFFDDNGDPLAGGKIYSYQAGTTTPQATYTDSTGATPNANPVILDAAGRAAIWLNTDLSYKFLIKTSADVSVFNEDNIIGLSTNNSVATASIQDLAVTTGKLADDSVTAAKLADSASIDANRAVTTDHIRDAAVTRAKLTTGSKGAETVNAKTTTYTATISDDVIPCSSAGGAYTITLPTAASASGRELTFVKTSSDLSLITIDGNGTETINGALTKALATQYESLTIYSDGSNWFIKRRYIQATTTSYSLTIGGSTSAPTKGTVVRDHARWRRDGDHAIISYDYYQSAAGSSGTGTYLFPLPTSLVIDTAIRAASADLSVTVGTGTHSNTLSVTTSIVTPVSVNIYNTTNLFLTAYNYSSPNLQNLIYNVGSTSSPHLGTVGSIVYSFNARVPIVGWEN